MEVESVFGDFIERFLSWSTTFLFWCVVTNLVAQETLEEGTRSWGVMVERVEVMMIMVTMILKINDI